jgi:hypothetical protein
MGRMDLLPQNEVLPLLVSSIVLITWGSGLLWRLPHIATNDNTQRIVIYILWTLSCFAMLSAPAWLIAGLAIPIAWLHVLG